jgi:hypothetical protein
MPAVAEQLDPSLAEFRMRMENKISHLQGDT